MKLFFSKSDFLVNVDKNYFLIDMEEIIYIDVCQEYLFKVFSTNVSEILF